MAVHAPPPSLFNFFLLLLSAWGEIADWHYVKKGGDPPTNKSRKWLWFFTLAFLVFLIFASLGGASPYALGYLSGQVFVLGFFGWEAWRFKVRRNSLSPK